MHQGSEKSGQQQLKNKKKIRREARRSYAQSYGERTFFWKGKINFGTEGKRQAASFAGIFLPALLFLLYEAQFQQGLSEEFGSILWQSICGIVSASCFALFLICSLSDPGYLTIPLNRKKRRQIPTIQKKGEQEFSLNLCTTCNIYRPIRTHHCRVCDLCVKERDHHCPFLNNCIGMSNRRSYIFFLLNTMVLEIIVTAESLCQIIKPFTNEGVEFVTGIKQVSVILACIQCLYSTLLGINIVSLFIFQIKLVAQNSTTDELRRLLKPQIKQVDLDIHKLYNQGILKNFRAILCCSNPPEPIYAHYEPLSLSYFNKRLNVFLQKRKKLSILNKTADCQQKNELDQSHLSKDRKSTSIHSPYDIPLNKLEKKDDLLPSSKESSHLKNDDIVFQENSVFNDKSEIGILVEQQPHPLKTTLREIELQAAYKHHIGFNPNLLMKHSPYEQQNQGGEGWDGQDLFGFDKNSERNSSRNDNHQLKLDLQDNKQRATSFLIYDSESNGRKSSFNSQLSQDIQIEKNNPKLKNQEGQIITINLEQNLGDFINSAERVVTKTDNENHCETENGFIEQDINNSFGVSPQSNKHTDPITNLLKIKPAKSKADQQLQTIYQSENIKLNDAPKLKTISISYRPQVKSDVPILKTISLSQHPQVKSDAPILKTIPLSQLPQVKSDALKLKYNTFSQHPEVKKRSQIQQTVSSTPLPLEQMEYINDAITPKKTVKQKYFPKMNQANTLQFELQKQSFKTDNDSLDQFSLQLQNKSLSFTSRQQKINNWSNEISPQLQLNAKSTENVFKNVIIQQSFNDFVISPISLEKSIGVNKSKISDQEDIVSQFQINQQFSTSQNPPQQLAKSENTILKFENLGSKRSKKTNQILISPNNNNTYFNTNSNHYYHNIINYNNNNNNANNNSNNTNNNSNNHENSENPKEADYKGHLSEFHSNGSSNYNSNLIGISSDTPSLLQ